MSRALLAYDPSLTRYNFGADHPMNPVRVELTVALAEQLGVLDNLTVSGFDPATDEQLATVHTPAFIDAVKACSSDPTLVDAAHGLGTTDTPVFAGMHEASAAIAGASLRAAQAVWNGEADHAVNIIGGLHHAMPGYASGFCVYNDIAMAIDWLLEAGAHRIVYIDVDVHHGDGVQRVFYDDPRVITISVHESPLTLFPGTGRPTETGGPSAIGSSLNLALPAGTGDADWLRAFEAIVPDVVSALRPDVLVTQHGCDSHRADPLANLELSVDGQRTSYRMLHDLAHTYADGKWLALGGGGYAVAEVVPRAWTHLLAIAAHAELDPATEIPQAWRDLVTERTGQPAPRRMCDGNEDAEGVSFEPFEHGFNPSSAVDQAVLATRRASFPYLGIDIGMF